MGRKVRASEPQIAGLACIEAPQIYMVASAGTWQVPVGTVMDCVVLVEREICATGV